MRAAWLLCLLVLAACTPESGGGSPRAPSSPSVEQPAPAPELLPRPDGADEPLGMDALPPPDNLDLPVVLVIPSTVRDAVETYEEDLGPLLDFGAIARIVMGIPDHSDMEGVAPPAAVAGWLFLEDHEWAAVDPMLLRLESRVVWPQEWGGAEYSVEEARRRLEARALADRRARWEEPAPWPDFSLPLSSLDGAPSLWPEEGLVMLHHPLVHLSLEARERLAAIPWVAVGDQALDGPWPAPGPWVGSVPYNALARALPPGADTLPLLLWFQGGVVVRWKAGLPPLEWLEPWTS